MQLNDFVAMMQGIAPNKLSMGYDNVGLLIGPESKDIKKVLVALDCSTITAGEAIRLNCELMLTHHPVFFHGAKRISLDDPATAGAYMLMRAGIGLYAAHTNLDACDGGVNDALCDALGIMEQAAITPDGIGRIGALRQPMRFYDYARLVEDRLGAAVRVSGDMDKLISKVAVVGGAGGEYAGFAQQAGADLFISGEFRHHEGIYAREMGLCIIDAGHYETEKPVLKAMINRLHRLCDDVQYNLTQCESGPLSRI